MSKSLLHLLSIGLLCLVFHGQGLKAPSFQPRKASSVQGNEAVYRALITGDKSGVSRKTIQTMKDFGLMHLLTPSGLHLGSFLVLFKLFPKLRFGITLVLFAASFFVPGFLALKRMIMFYLANHCIKNVRLSFMVTLLAALVTGNYQESPISFCFTLLFWGAIVFHNGGKLSLILTLFAMQAVTSLVLGQTINLAAVAVNPLITGAFTLIFPALLFLYPLEFTRQAGLWILEGFDWILVLLQKISFLDAPPELALFLVFVSVVKHKKTVMIALILFSTSLNPQKEMKRKKINAHYPLPSKLELLSVKKEKIEFIDRKCVWKAQGEVYCKKKPSRYGGPSI